MANKKETLLSKGKDKENFCYIGGKNDGTLVGKAVVDALRNKAKKIGKSKGTRAE
ncbi:MAG: hypothetical protein IKK83_01480 [Clostridia bacterium]|nr:hypothetical protein [Clostridia bacterium]